jgi:hypothetical protein
MRLFTLIVLTALGTSATSNVHAQSCYESFISTPSPFMGNNDEVFKLGDGSIWQVKYEYQYLYAYHPSVVICPGKSKLIINGKQLNVELLSEKSRGSRTGAGSTKRAKSTQTGRTVQSVALGNAEGEDDRSRETDANALIETQIAGDFSGWEGETIFKLVNGQIWQQTQYAYTYHYAFRPKVMIFRSTGGYQMQVDGMDKTIGVTRLK